MRLPLPDFILLSSLRTRLTAWNTLVVLLVTVLSLLAARFAARVTLYDDADAELRAGAKEILLAVEDLQPDIKAVISQIRRMAASHEERGWFIMLLSEDGEVFWRSEHCPDVVANLAPFNLDLPENVVQVGPFRYVRLKTSNVTPPIYHVRVGTYTTGLDDRLTSLVRQLVILGAVLTLLTPLVGWWLARRATRPIADILETTDRLRATRLGDRLPVCGSNDELDRLSATINRLLDNVATHVDRQERFLADAAHELRGPLTAMQSALEVALARQRSSEDYLAVIRDVLGESRHLSKLTNDLLLLAEDKNGKEPNADTALDLSPVAQTVGAMFTGVAEDRGISLLVDAPAEVRVIGDMRGLRQVCSNLIDNAIRFTQPGGRVSLKITADPMAREAVIAVEDTGCGIGPGDLPRVFDRFFQADSARDRRDATRGGGLGLPISKAIVERHRGRIDVESRTGAGTKFTVRLPLA